MALVDSIKELEAVSPRTHRAPISASKLSLKNELFNTISTELLENPTSIMQNLRPTFSIDLETKRAWTRAIQLIFAFVIFVCSLASIHSFPD